MKRSLFLAVLAFAAWAHAETGTALSPKAQLAADNKAALVRYDSDKKLCNDEGNAAARLQCRRDAKTEYDKALTEARAKMAAAAPASAAVPAAAKQKSTPACLECGKVTEVSASEKAGEGGPLGMIAGGAAGALLGHQVGSGTGKDLATIAGAVGGAYAGKKIEEKAKAHQIWTIGVEFGDGSKGRYEFAQDPGFKVGDAVKKSGNTIVR